MFSFAKRKAQNEVDSVLRRIIDRTTPNLTPLDGATRRQNRHNRTLPVLLTPRQGRSLMVDDSISGLTKDVADHGLAVIVTEPISDQDVAVTFWLAVRQSPDSEPIALLGHARNCMEIGGGFWQVGIELTERLDVDDTIALVPSAGQLIPDSEQIAVSLAE